MPERVDIPVAVTGAEEAQAKLAALSSAVAGAGQAGAAAAPGLQQAAQASSAEAGAAEAAADAAGQQASAQSAAAGATAPAAEAQRTLGAAIKANTGAGRELLVQIVNQLAPGWGQLVAIATRAGEAIKSITTQMLLFAGVGLALAAIAAVFSAIAGAAERAAEAIRKQREAEAQRRKESREQRESIALEAAQAGVFGAGATLQRRVADLRDRTSLPEEVLRSAVIAQARYGLSDAQREDLLAGIVAQGGKPIELSGKREDLAVVQRTLRAGRSGEARAALALLERDLSAASRAEALDAAAAELAQRRPELDAKQVARVRELAASDEALRAAEARQQMRWIVGAPDEEELIREARFLRTDRRVAQRPEPSAALQRLLSRYDGVAEKPLIVQQRTMNVGTQYFTTPPLQRGASPMQAEDVQSVE